MSSSPAAYSTGHPIKLHHDLKRVLATCPCGRCKMPPSRIVYRADRILVRFAWVHPSGSAWVKLRFSGSGRSTFSDRMKERLAMSPRGSIELPVNIWIVVDGTVSETE